MSGSLDLRKVRVVLVKRLARLWTWMRHRAYLLRKAADYLFTTFTGSLLVILASLFATFLLEILDNVALELVANRLGAISPEQRTNFLVLILTVLVVMLLIVVVRGQARQRDQASRILRKFAEVEHVEEVLDPDEKAYMFEGRVYKQLAEEMRKAEKSIFFLTIATLGEEWIFSDAAPLPRQPDDLDIQKAKAHIALQQSQITAQQRHVTEHQLRISQRHRDMLVTLGGRQDDNGEGSDPVEAAGKTSHAALEASEAALKFTGSYQPAPERRRTLETNIGRVETALDKYKQSREDYLTTFRALMNDKLQTAPPDKFILRRIYQQSPSRWTGSTPGPLEALSQKHVDDMKDVTAYIDTLRQNKHIHAEAHIIVAKDSRNTGFVIIDNKTLIIQLSATDQYRRPYMASLLIYRLHENNPIIRSYIRRFETIWSVATGRDYSGNVLLNWRAG